MRYFIKEVEGPLIAVVTRTGDEYTWADKDGVKQDKAFEGYESWTDLRQMMGRNLWMELIWNNETEVIFSGHRGHYAHVDVIQLALDYGMPNKPDENGIGFAELVADYMETGGTGDYCEFSAEASDEAEDWLNTHIAESGHFGWEDGEFYFLNDSDEGSDDD